MISKKYCILTNDVETTSLANHCLSMEAGDLVLKQGMPRLLDLYEKYNVKSTFFFCGDIVRQHPEVVTMILKNGHEVASHGWVHDSDKAFDVLSLTEQIEHLRLSKIQLEQISERQVLSFRAPALRINKDTSMALKANGFEIDSSVASQRLDMFLSFGGLKKIIWFFSPRMPYFSKRSALWSKGIDGVFEIPVSAIAIPYIGTSLRLMPLITSVLRFFLHWESLITGKPIVFLTHPNEFIDEKISIHKTKRRSKSYLGYLLGDVLRRKMKLKNLGSRGIPLYEREIQFFKSKGYQFITCEEYYKIFKKS